MNFEHPPECYTSEINGTTTPSIAIVGAGVSGLTLAFQLLQKQPQCQLSIFCADDDVATAGSGNDQGAIYPLLQADKTVLARFYDSAYRYAMNFYRTNLPSNDIVQHQWCGVMQQAINDQLVTKYTAIAALFSDITQLMTPEQSSQVTGLRLPYPSLFYVGGGWINPKQYCQWLKAQLALTGQVRFYFNSPVIAIKKVKTDIAGQLPKWRALTIGDSENPTPDTNCTSNDINQITGKINDTFDQIVISAGVNSIDFDVSNDLVINPVLGQVSKLSANSSVSDLKTVLCHKGYMTPSNGDFQSFGATFENRPEIIKKGAVTSREANLQNISQIQSVYQDQTWANALSEHDIIDENAAFRATTGDHLPLCGELFSWSWVAHYIDNNTGRYKRKDKIKGDIKNDYAGLYMMTGLGARGLTSAPLIAHVLSNDMLGLPTDAFIDIKKAVAPLRYKLREYRRTKKLPKTETTVK